MKKYNVFQYNLALSPLEGNNTRRPSEIEYFDTEEEAIIYAKSKRKNWDRISVNQTKPDKPIVLFHHNDMYIEAKRIRLEDE